jgi:tetratricopeptide (TPR) repeat protein
MPISRIGSRAAVANMRGNDIAHWPRRGTANSRIEPVAQPAFATSFAFRQGATIFTIGSCFARHIERALEERGFQVPARRFFDDDKSAAVDNGMLHNYSVPAIHNEIRWALGLGAPYEPRDHLFEVYPGKFADVHLQVRIPLCSYDEALQRRRRIFEVNGSIRHADAAVITLGLVEVWWDRQTGTYLNAKPYETVIRSAPDRFELHVLGYDEVYAQLDALFQMIFEHCSIRHGIILTVSPVPLSATYTGQDVAVANQYSKAVLRAAAQAIIARYDRVDYFPAYETVVLSDRARAWKDDLIHVTPEMVDVNVARMLAAYVVDDPDAQAPPAPAPVGAEPAKTHDGAPGDAALAAARELVKAKQLEAAIDAVSAHVEGPVAVKALRIVGECQYKLGQLQPAETTLRRAVSLNIREAHAHGYLGLVLRKQGRLEEAISELQTAVDFSPASAWWLNRLIETLLQGGRAQEAASLIERGLGMWPDHAGLLRLRRRLR